MARVEDIVIEEPAYDWLDFPFWAEAVSYGRKFHSFVAWLADTDAYLCAVVINHKAEFLTMLARICDEIAVLQETKNAGASPCTESAKLALPEPWIKIMDPATRAPYYYNMVSGKSQWEFPTSDSTAALVSPRSVVSPKPCSSRASATPNSRDPMARDPRRKPSRVGQCHVGLLHCPSLLLDKHEAVHVHRY